MFHERHSRTILKSITWRVLAFCASITVLYYLTGDINRSLYHAIIIEIVKTIIYYAHERLWNMTDFGQEIRSVKPRP